MYYCRLYGDDEREPCYPSLCDDIWCEYRMEELEQYNRLKVLVLERGINWCEQRCRQRCDSPYGSLCDEEIERLRDLGLDVQDLLPERDGGRKLISLEAERYKRKRNRQRY